MGLCRDDGLIVLNKITSQYTDKIRKKIIHVFKDNGFSIEIRTGLVEVNFLNITFNLSNGSYQPYKKPNDELKYINVLFNQPLQSFKQLTTIISDTLSRNSSSDPVFNESKHQYEDALRKSCFKSKHTYQQLIWFNPPYNQNVSTNITQIFSEVVDKHFPLIHRLHMIFNRNTIKVSCSCMSYVQKLFKKHKNLIQNKKNKTTVL